MAAASQAAGELQGFTGLLSALLFAHHWGRGRRRCRRLWRDGQGHPRVPALRPVLGLEFPVGLQVEIALGIFADREDVAELRPEAEHARLEAAEPVAQSAVARDLLEGIADDAELQLLGEEVRQARIEVHVDA